MSMPMSMSMPVSMSLPMYLPIPMPSSRSISTSGSVSIALTAHLSPTPQKNAQHTTRPNGVPSFHVAAGQVLWGGIAATFGAERAAREGSPGGGVRARPSDVRRRRATNRQRGAQHHPIGPAPRSYERRGKSNPPLRRPGTGSETGPPVSHPLGRIDSLQTIFGSADHDMCAARDHQVQVQPKVFHRIT